MISSYGKSVWGVVVLFLSIAPWEIFGQSKDPRALNLFRNAADESDLNRKIAIYRQAVEIDPLFVEALFNLGLLYKQQQDYQNAERFLLQGSRAATGPFQAEMKVRIFYELANVCKRAGKIKESEEYLRLAKPLAADKELRSIILFDLGRLLFEQQQYEESFAVLKEGEKLGGKNKTYFANFMQAAEQGMALQKLYDTALQTEASGNLKEARNLFSEIQAKNPGYKDVEARLVNLDSLLSPETAQKQVLAAMYEEAGRYAAEANFGMAVSTYESILRQAGSYKDVQTRLDETRQQLAAQQRNAILEGEYATGAAALRAQNWTRAIITFERIVSIDENFRDARTLLREAQDNLERESAETICVRYYADGVAAMNQNDLGSALAAFEKVKRLNPNYRDLPALLGAVELALQSQSSAAAASFSAAEGNMATSVPLAGDVSLETPPSAVTPGSADGDARVFYFASAFVALIVLPLVGFVFFSPNGRARLYLLFGNYAATMRIYENMLIRHPERARLNPTVINTLATYYLLERRMDERALDVYQQVQRLNLSSVNREEINTILQQHRLTAGQRSSDAAGVLEQMLKTKTSRT